MNALENRIRELRQRYAQTLPERLASIARTLIQAGEAMQAGETNIPRAELLRQFHTLAGTAGTFGFEDIATLAADAECILSTASVPYVTPGEVERLASRLLDLDAALRRHLEGVGSHGAAWSTFEGGGVL
ncbi:MAG: Hpt domain-containing protein [Acidobacteriota bacterium]|nr:Hpt domain-containing protein [Acidobacteriota bacterium]